MSDWGAPDVQAWKRDARALQQNMFLRLGDRRWDQWFKWEETILHRKVGFGLFSLPENLPDEDNPTGYSEKQFEKIIKVSDVILRNAKSGRFIHFACIFVFGKMWEKRFDIPVFKVKGDGNQTLFVDSDCRVYNNWRDYLDKNRLPKCMYCYPRSGIYQGDEGQVLVDFGTSPACDLVNRVWSVFDSAATVVSLTSTTVLAASLLTVPIAAPVLAVAQAAATGTGIYSATRSGTNLADRYWHGQSIGLGDSEARMDWLGIVGSAIGIAQSRMYSNITRIAASGGIANKALRITFNVLTVGSLTVDGLGTLNGFISLVDKSSRGTLTPLDVFHWSTSVLFFSNSLLDTSTARSLIESTQQEVLNRHCDDLTAPQIDELFRLSDQVQGRTQLHRNANKVKMINNIHDIQAFYGSLVTARTDLEDDWD